MQQMISMASWHQPTRLHMLMTSGRWARFCSKAHCAHGCLNMTTGPPLHDNNCVAWSPHNSLLSSDLSRHIFSCR